MSSFRTLNTVISTYIYNMIYLFGLSLSVYDSLKGRYTLVFISLGTFISYFTTNGPRPLTSFTLLQPVPSVSKSVRSIYVRSVSYVSYY